MQQVQGGRREVQKDKQRQVRAAEVHVLLRTIQQPQQVPEARGTAGAGHQQQGQVAAHAQAIPFH